VSRTVFETIPRSSEGAIDRLKVLVLLSERRVVHAFDENCAAAHGTCAPSFDVVGVAGRSSCTSQVLPAVSMKLGTSASAFMFSNARPF
jgi:hypothetical protein